MSTQMDQTPVKGMPPELAEKGWQLFLSDSMKFRASVEVNGDELVLGPYPTAQEAIDDARNRQVEIDEILPEDIIESGWRLEEGKKPLPYSLVNDKLELNTENYRYVAGAIEKAREMEIEKAERDAVATDGNVAAVAAPAKISPSAASVDVTSVDVTMLMHPDEIRTDGGTQPREALDMVVVAEYKEAMIFGAVFPSADVFYDGQHYWLADGFHRHRATIEAELEEMLVTVHDGTQRDALLFSFGANETHGLRRSNADKRRAVLTMLHDDEWRELSDTVIAETAKVSQPFVSKLRREISQNVLSGEAQPTARKGKDGIVRETANIGGRGEGEIAATDDRQRSLADIGVELPPRTEFEEETEESLAAQAQRREIAGDWSTDEVVSAIRKNGGSMFRGELEERGCSYAAILGALHDEAITQPETGKYALRDLQERSEAFEKKHGTDISAAPAPSPRPTKAKVTVEELLKGRMLVVSFTWIPGLKNKVSVSVNAGQKPENASREVIDSIKTPQFPDEVQALIVQQLKNPPAVTGSTKRVKTPARSRPARKSVAKKAAKKAAKKPTKGRRR